MTEVVAETVGDRVAGRAVSRRRALLVSGIAAVGAGVATYKLLRSGG